MTKGMKLWNILSDFAEQVRKSDKPANDLKDKYGNKPIPVDEFLDAQMDVMTAENTAINETIAKILEVLK